MPEKVNGIELGSAGRHLRISGRDFLIISILGCALGFLVWENRVYYEHATREHNALRAAIRQFCLPKPYSDFDKP